MMFAKLSPDGTKVAWVDFDRKDLFVQDLESLEVTRLTNDKGEHIINGTSDWVYEEEFDLRDGFRWSPDSRHIAYWQFDSEGVGTFNLINNTDTLYPELTPIPYPKVGTTNSACRVGVIPAGGGETTWFEPEGDPRKNYIPKMGWAESSGRDLADPSQPAAEHRRSHARRHRQRRAPHRLHRPRRGLGRHARRSPVDRRRPLLHLAVGARRLAPPLSGVPRSGEEVRLVTAGDYDVIELAHVDDAGGWAYFMASPRTPPAATSTGPRSTAAAALERVTPAGPAGTHSYQISEDARWAIHGFSSRETRAAAPTSCRSPITRCAGCSRTTPTVQNAFDAVAKAPIETFRVDIGDGVEVDGWMITPPDFDPTKSYPLLMYVYGEPAGQTVQNRWGRGNGMWHLLLAQTRLRRGQPRQPRHPGAARPRVAQVGLPADRQSSPRPTRRRGCGRCSSDFHSSTATASASGAGAAAAR